MKSVLSSNDLSTVHSNKENKTLQEYAIDDNAGFISSTNNSISIGGWDISKPQYSG